MTPHPIDASEGSEEFSVIRSSVFILLFLSARSVFSQQPQLSDEIVVTASGVEETIEKTPAAVTVISRDEIERREARDVAEALRAVPGVVVARSGSQGKVSSLFIRGGNSQHTAVLWNGMEINNPFFSGYDWGRFSTAGVERIEVVPGPYSALYGSDAVSGVVNILTTPGRDFFSADIEAGEDGLFNGAFAGAATRGSLMVHGSAEYRTDDGFAPNDDFRQDAAMGGVRWRIAPNGSLALQARFSRYDLGVPRNVSADGASFVPSPDRRQEGTELQISVPLTYQAGGFEIDARLSRSARNDDYSDPDDPFGQTWASTDSITQRAMASAARKTSAGYWTFGSEYETSTVDDASSFGANLNGRDRTSRSFFVEDRVSIRLPRTAALEMTAGARYDSFDTFGSELSPRIAAALVRGSRKFRVAYGEAFRAPSIGELYYPFFGNPQLEPERGRSLEVGFDTYHRSATFSVTAFRGAYDDLIVYDNVINSFGNVATASTAGVEVSLSGSLGGSWSGAATYAWLDTEQDDTGEALLRRPRHSGTVSLAFERGPFNALLVGMHSGARNDVTDLFPFGVVINEAHTTADLTLHYGLGAVRPYLKIENLADVRYEEVFGYPSPRRRAVVGVRYSVGR